MLVDEAAGATVRQLGDALTELELNGHFLRTCSLTLVLYADARLDQGPKEQLSSRVGGQVARGRASAASSCAISASA
jgi:hypothetical protein